MLVSGSPYINAMPRAFVLGLFKTPTSLTVIVSPTYSDEQMQTESNYGIGSVLKDNERRGSAILSRAAFIVGTRWSAVARGETLTP